MWTDDISFCPIEKCRRKTCFRNQMNIRDKTIPHSFFVERPPDCPYRKRQDDFYHIRKKAATTMPDRETVITHLQIIHTWAEFARERDLQFFTPKHLEDIAQWSDDAIELLKEQEDEIKTLAEHCYNVDVNALLGRKVVDDA